MEFGVIGSCFSGYPWRDFLDATWRVGGEAIELDTRPGAHCSTWSPDRDPEAVLAELRDFGLRVGAVASHADLVQSDETLLAREVEEVRGLLDLAFRNRAEVVRLAPPRPKPGMSREAMVAAFSLGCRQAVEHAEESGMLLCIQADRDVLADPGTLLRVIEESESYNLRVTLDAVELLRILRDVEAVREAVATLVPATSHVILRDARLNPRTREVTEVAIGDGISPVEFVVSALMSASYFRPFYVGYWGEDDPVEVARRGIGFFRDLPDRLLKESGMLI
jgi:sugar phosphate isomerase/epimerase